MNIAELIPITLGAILGAAIWLISNDYPRFVLSLLAVTGTGAVGTLVSDEYLAGEPYVVLDFGEAALGVAAGYGVAEWLPRFRGGLRAVFTHKAEWASGLVGIVLIFLLRPYLPAKPIGMPEAHWLSAGLTGLVLIQVQRGRWAGGAALFVSLGIYGWASTGMVHDVHYVLFTAFITGIGILLVIVIPQSRIEYERIFWVAKRFVPFPTGPPAAPVIEAIALIEQGRMHPFAEPPAANWHVPVPARQEQTKRARTTKRSKYARIIDEVVAVLGGECGVVDPLHFAGGAAPGRGPQVLGPSAVLTCLELRGITWYGRNRRERLLVLSQAMWHEAQKNNGRIRSVGRGLYLASPP